MSESTCRARCYSGEDCLKGVRTYLSGTVLQGCMLFKLCQNLTVMHCVTVMKAVLEMSVYLPGTVIQWCRLFKQCRNFPAWHCVTVVEAV